MAGKDKIKFKTIIGMILFNFKPIILTNMKKKKIENTEKFGLK